MKSRAEILDLLIEQPLAIAHAVGFKDMTELHNQWLKSFLFSSDDLTLLAHRGSYKTTAVSVFLALHTILRPNQNILFFRKTEGDTHEVIKQTAKILETDILQYIAAALYGREMVLIEKSGGKITTNLTTTKKGASQILGLGIGTSITGKHADIICTDDIVNLSDRISKAERERTKYAYQELQNICNRGGRFINTGTPWHRDDAISTLMPHIKKYSVYDTGLITEEKQNELRASMTPSLYAANYELKHIADADALFSSPSFENDKEKIKEGSAHIDAAYGGGDYTAYTIMRQDEETGDIIAYGKIWQKHVDECLNEIKALHNYYRAGSISCERNADKGYLARELEQKGFYVETYHESMNKFIKISSYLKANWHRIKWIEETDPEYLQQVLDYTEHAEHDDAPDSAASCIRRLTERAEAVTADYLTGGI